MKRLTVLLIVGMTVTAVIALFTLFTPTAQADNVGGIIDTDTTWTLSGSPYIITDTVTIQPGVTLTIEAGVEVQAEPDTEIMVNGALLALGTLSQPITFTSTSETSPGDWYGIYIGNHADLVQLRHTTVQYAQFSLLSENATSRVELENSIIRQNHYALIVGVEALHQLQMNNVTFDENIINHVIIDTNDVYALTGNATLVAQPGLEGYEIYTDNQGPAAMLVPEGITLTLEAGTTLTMPENGDISVEGHLETTGTATQPVTFTSALNSAPSQWEGINVFEETGTVHLNHATVQYAHYSLGINNATSRVEIENSLIRQNHYALIVRVDVLHQLQMSNVTFDDNDINHVFIDMYGSFFSLIGDATLTAQPGLEGYEIVASNNYPLEVPNSITLTLEAGTTLMMPDDSGINIYGHLQAEGTAVAPVTITSVDNPNPNAWRTIYVYDTGSVSLENSIIQYGTYGVDIFSGSDNSVHLKDTVLRRNGNGMFVEIGGLHRLHMDNVIFENNMFNRIWLSWSGGGQVLTDNVTLTSQPGLEGYELRGTSIDIPAGITLTLDAGVTIMADWNINIEGHLQANGTISEPVTFTSADDLTPGAWGAMGAVESGSLQLINSIIEYATIGIASSSDNLIEIQDTVLRENEYPVVVSPNELHLLQMDNVSFENNVRDRVFIYTTYNNMIVDDTSLKSLPGLEGYQVDGENNLVIQSSATLTMAAGSTLMMNPEANPSRNLLERELIVHGRLQAEGTAVAPVTFTSSEDNAPGQWAGIVVDGGEVSLAHAEVRYATTNLTVNSPTSTVAITSSRLISASVNGLTVNDGAVNAACSVIAGNGQNGVSISASGSPSVTIITSEIWGNGVGITNSHSLPVDARHNFWGDPSGPGGIGPGSGDAVYGNVLYDPWLTEAECLPPPEPIFTVYLPVIAKP